MVRKTKEEAWETRNRILDAAEAEFHSNGVSRTSLADIAKAAQVTRGAIYWHFKNKADLFDAMMQRMIEPWEAMSQGQDHLLEENPLAWVRSVVLYILERLATDPLYQRIFDIAWHKCEYVNEMARIRDRHLECGQRYIGMMERAMRKAQQHGQLSKRLDPHQAAVGLMAVMDGLIVNWTLDPRLFPLEKVAAGIIDTYLDGLSVQHAAEANP